MKAAVIYQKGAMPVYTDIPEPVPANNGELLITMKAAALKHLDKSMAKGTHYTSATDNAAKAKVICGDGVGILANGSRVYALGTDGMAAQKAIIRKDRMVYVPDGIDDATAAALPNGILIAETGALLPGPLTQEQLQDKPRIFRLMSDFYLAEKIIPNKSYFKKYYEE